MLTARTDEPRLIEGAEILGNDTDPDSDTLTLDSFTQPGTGRVTRNGDQLTYTANRSESSDVREDIELTHALPVTVMSDKATRSSFPLTRLTDDYTVNTWFTHASPGVLIRPEGHPSQPQQPK